MKQYTAIIAFSDGSYKSVPASNIKSKKEFLNYVLEKVLFPEDILSITITVKEIK